MNFLITLFIPRVVVCENDVENCEVIAGGCVSKFFYS